MGCAESRDMPSPVSVCANGRQICDADRFTSVPALELSSVSAPDRMPWAMGSIALGVPIFYSSACEPCQLWSVMNELWQWSASVDGDCGSIAYMVLSEMVTAQCSVDGGQQIGTCIVAPKVSP